MAMLDGKEMEKRLKEVLEKTGEQNLEVSRNQKENKKVTEGRYE